MLGVIYILIDLEIAAISKGVSQWKVNQTHHEVQKVLEQTALEVEYDDQ